MSKEEPYLIGIVVGYVLKIMKNHKGSNKFKSEFTSIRHGNYPEFIDLVKGSVPEMVIYRGGEVEVNPEPRKNDIDMVGLFMAGNSLKKFYGLCVKEYGVFDDIDITDDLYYKIALFEIIIRIHANNHKTILRAHTLEQIINQLGISKGLNQNEILKIQKGRKLLNMIKHGKKINYSWNQGIFDFNNAYEFLLKKNITL